MRQSSRLIAVCILCAFIAQGAMAQQIVPGPETIYLNENEEEPLQSIDDVDNIFDEAEDISVSDEQEAQQEEASRQANKQEKFSLGGSLLAGIGGIWWITPDGDTSPYAELEAHMGVTMRPADILTIKSDVQAKFSGSDPGASIDWKLNTLYFDYILLDKVFVTVGRTATTWSCTRLFDSNILDDGIYTVNTDSSVLDTTKTVASQYLDAMVTIPLGHGRIQALIMYEPFTKNSSGKYVGTADDLCYAAEVEYPFGPVVVNLFGRTWADPDPAHMTPVLGAKLTSDIAKFHCTAWGKMNVRRHGMPQYAKGILSASRVWDRPKIGVVLEYQLTYNNLDDERIDARIESGSMEEVAKFSNAIAFTWTWQHIFGSDFAPMLQGFFDFENKCGAFIPGISWTGLPLVTASFIVPMFYGDQTNITYSDQIINSTSDEPTVLMGLVLRLSISF